MSESSQALINEMYVNPRYTQEKLWDGEYGEYYDTVTTPGAYNSYDDALNAIRGDLVGLLGSSFLNHEAPTYSGYIPPPSNSTLPQRTLPTLQAQQPYMPPTSNFSVPSLSVPNGAPPGAGFKYNTGVINNGT